MFLQKFEYGDTALYFAQCPQKNTKKASVGLHVLPKGASYEPKGSDAPLFYAEFEDGMHFPAKVQRQVQFLSGNLNSYIADESGAEYIHKIVFDRDTGVFSASIRYENKGEEPKSLRFLSAFSFGFCPSRGMKIYRMGSAFAYAYALREEDPEGLGLGFENSPTLSFGRDGRFMPFLAIETEDGVLAIRLDAPDKFEICLRRDAGRIEVFGGERFGCKQLKKGEFHETPKVHITLQPTLNLALRALNSRIRKKLSAEDDPPIVCSAENISPGNIKKFAALLRDFDIPTAVLEDGKKPRTPEELQNMAAKLVAEGIRAERALSGVFLLPKLSGATAIAAANISRIFPARKIVSELEVTAAEDDGTTLFNFCSAAMTRIKLKGELLKLSEEKAAYLKTLLAFYERAFEVVSKGDVYVADFSGSVSAEPLGRQIYGMELNNLRYLLVWFWEEGAVKIPLEGYEIKEQVSKINFAVRSDTLKIVGKPNEAGAFLLEKRQL